MEINIALILQILGLVLPLAVVIARLTPTKKDDDFIEKIRKVFEWIYTLGLPNIVEVPIKKKK